MKELFPYPYAHHLMNTLEQYWRETTVSIAKFYFSKTFYKALPSNLGQTDCLTAKSGTGIGRFASRWDIRQGGRVTNHKKYDA
ncbi:MAG: hypothetical protein RMM51_05540 [Verrucomicrobiae bacterium]|nr:hypothetical protein [Verrucomicrobiae bacterium]